MFTYTDIYIYEYINVCTYKYVRHCASGTSSVSELMCPPDSSIGDAKSPTSPNPHLSSMTFPPHTTPNPRVGNVTFPRPITLAWEMWLAYHSTPQN